MEEITNIDYSKKKRVCVHFEIKNSDEYLDLNFQSDTLLLADVVNIFGNICFKLYKLDTSHFHFAPGLVW